MKMIFLRIQHSSVILLGINFLELHLTNFAHLCNNYKFKNMYTMFDYCIGESLLIRRWNNWWRGAAKKIENADVDICDLVRLDTLNVDLGKNEFP